MKSTKWMFACALGILTLTGNFALAQGHGNGHGKGHNKHGDDEDQGDFYKDRDREVMRSWYDNHQSNLPPRACQERPSATWFGKTTCAARHASAGAPETLAALSRGIGATTTTATS